MNDETKHEAMGRLMRSRLDKIRRQAGLLINLAGPNYVYNQADVDYLRDQLYCIVDETMAAFGKPKEIKDESERNADIEARICPNCGDNIDWVDEKQAFVCCQCPWSGCEKLGDQ